ncbi:hypothetical protein BDY24DRAFT_164004 [Mrakia frigida]|uniref:uncharacterized protein n=1 Tax=Mrakia frigida TaxID=29902 RepID=UPI003FCBF3C6
MATLAPPPPTPAVPFLASSHTLAHLLSLPPLLLPLSPHLSSLHLARLRLLAALPSETTHLICCSKCGALHVPGWTSTVEVGRGRLKTATKGGGVGGRKKKAFNRIKTTCLVCGEVDCRPGSDKKTLESFPSTRRTRRQQQIQLEEEEKKVDQAQAQVVPSSLPPSVVGSAVSTPMEVDSPSASASASSTPLASTSNPSSSYFPPFPSATASALSSPRLKHVPLSHPTVPSIAPPSPVAAAGEGKDAGGAGRKKKKKSGLQKMLALNKEKEEEEARKKKAGGGGGLMDWMT